MGTYDYVNFKCPHCGGKVELQSKAHLCECEEFDKNSIPLPFAADLQFDLTIENTTCEYCGGRFRFESSAPNFVTGNLVPFTEEN